MAGLAASFGSGAMTNSLSEISGSDVIMVIGSNTSENHPVIAFKIKKAVRNGTRLIVADPRKIDLVELADVWLRHKPGTDVALINGMMHVIIREGLWAKEYVKERTEGFEELKDAVEKYDPAIVEKITGVPASLIEKAARLYAEAEKAAIYYAMGITQHITGTDNVKSLANLAMLCGNVGIESGGVNPLRGQNNVQGACDMGGLPNVLTGYQPVTSSEAREKFERAWGVKLNDKTGLTVVEMMQAAAEGKIKAMYIMGENPMISDPDLHHVEKALRSLDFLIVQDMFMTETARLAHVVLPSASYAEREGTVTNTERRVQRFYKAIDPPEEARSDWEIICDLAGRMGHNWQYDSASEIQDEIASLTPSYAGITYDRLEDGGLQWPCPSKDHPGTKYLHKDKFARGKGKFFAIDHHDPDELPDDKYPFLLTTGRLFQHFHTGSMTRRVAGLEMLSPEGPVEINPRDAERLGVCEGDMVELISRRGRIKTKVKVTDRSPEGVAFMSFHFSESPVNMLTNPALDPTAKIPEYKVCAIRIEKI